MQILPERLMICLAFVVGMAMMTIFLCLVWAPLLDSNPRQAQTYEEVIYDTHIVQPGDSLWRIAQYYRPDTATARVVEEIRRDNRLEDATIYPGDLLRIRR